MYVYVTFGLEMLCVLGTLIRFYTIFSPLGLYNVIKFGWLILPHKRRVFINQPPYSILLIFIRLGLVLCAETYVVCTTIHIDIVCA